MVWIESIAQIRGGRVEKQIPKPQLTMGAWSQSRVGTFRINLQKGIFFSRPGEGAFPDICTQIKMIEGTKLTS